MTVWLLKGDKLRGYCGSCVLNLLPCRKMDTLWLTFAEQQPSSLTKLPAAVGIANSLLSRVV
jgi:hypothetical protein